MCPRHGGTYCAQLGSTSPTNGDSTIAQTFIAPAGATAISLWYKMSCPDTVTYDWAVSTVCEASLLAWGGLRGPAS